MKKAFLIPDQLRDLSRRRPAAATERPEGRRSEAERWPADLLQPWLDELKSEGGEA